MSVQASSQQRQLPQSTPLQAVQFWSWVGIFLLGIQIYYTIKWVTSEHWAAVPAGPDVPPEWMQWTLDIGQIALTSTVFLCFLWFVLKPLIRERRLSTDGLIFIGCYMAAGWDALSNVGQYWFTYNSYLVNRGSILAVMPITVSPHTPGSADAWPIFFIGSLYGHFIFVALGVCAFLKKLQSIWPDISVFKMVLAAYFLGAVLDFILEGLILLPLGFWSYAGGHWAINADHYYKFPLHEALCVGWIFAGLGIVRFFIDDKGQTLFERGLDKLKYSAARKSFTRCTAVLGGIISLYIVFYHLPQGFIALHSTEWPDDLVQRSYMTSRICGPTVDRACPGPNTPIARQHSEQPPYRSSTEKLPDSP